MKLLADVYLLGALDREGVRRMQIERTKAEAAAAESSLFPSPRPK